MQLKAKELELLYVAAATLTSLSRCTEFDVSKQILFVPPVQKAEVDKFFSCFKKIASSLVWPQEMQTCAVKHATRQGTGRHYNSYSYTTLKSLDLLQPFFWVAEFHHGTAIGCYCSPHFCHHV